MSQTLTALASSLTLFNSHSRSKVDFKPIYPGQVGFYLCGPTTYGLIHIGNARTLTNIDTAVRFLRFAGWDVKFVRNITDIDDKIINRANERGVNFKDFAESMADELHADLDYLGLLKPDREPRASEYVEQIIAMCKTLQDKGSAYQNSDGDLLFRVESFPTYGSLSKQNLDQLLDSARKEISTNKESPLDFVLWKQAKPGEPSWPSPWGDGRPGWHIECSAMNLHELGADFDIHAGGSDLMFPHHENEIAQSCCATHGNFAHNWLHTGMLSIDSVKMSKSLNNFVTARQILEAHDHEAVRFFLISNHYRSIVDYSPETIEVATKNLDRLYTALKDSCPELITRAAVADPEHPYHRYYNKDVVYAAPAEYGAGHVFGQVPARSQQAPWLTLAELAPELQADEHVVAFSKAMLDDFNTPEALAVLFALVRRANSATGEQKQRAGFLLRVLANALGLLWRATPDYFNATDSLDLDPAYIEELIERRKQARAEKNWAVADQVRDELNRLNIVLEDGVNGTTWKVKK